MVWNLGSVQVEVSKLIESIPTAISGTEMNSLIDRERIYLQNILGVNIGSNSIGESHQQVLVDLTAVSVINSMELTGADVSSVSLGEFSESKGAQSNLSIAKTMFHTKALEGIKALGIRNSMYKSFG